MSDASGAPQARADQIRAFQAELQLLEGEGLLALDPATADRLRAHHAQVLARLAADADVDTTASMHQLSLGLRLATMLGTVALSAAVVLFVLRVWGHLPTAAQLGLALAAPLVPLGIAELAARRERSLYVASLFAMVAVAGFAANLAVIHQVLNLPDNPHPALAVGGVALLLAYRYDILVLLATGLGAVGWWVAASLYSLLGGWFPDFPALPETIAVPALVVLLLPAVVHHRSHPRFNEVYRAFAIVVLGIIASGISLNGELSLLPFGRRGAEMAYTLGGLTLGIGAMIAGVRRGWHQSVRAGAGVALLLMLVKAVDWWWDLLPAWLFFLVLGALALASIVGLRRLRAAAATQ
ncbi:MAG: DUF2157 domain-containing protein [Gemmatimonadales bacterium]|nr:DUF2157 domain-containing protein [Gemmatimonadales bacterium]